MTSEDNTARYALDDTVTISRGKQRGQTGTVLSVDTEHKQYAVQTPDGLKIVSFSAVKPKQEASLTAGQLAQAFSEVVFTPDQPFIDALERLAPGITEQVQRTVKDS